MLKAAQKGCARCLLGTLVLALSSCTAILDFSEPITRTDAGPDDAMPQADAMLPPVCSTFESNDSTAAARPLMAMDIASAICPETDLDFFSFVVADGEDVSITLNFTPGAGADLDLRLLNTSGGIEGESKGTSNSEQIIRALIPDANALAAGTYYIEVVAKQVTDFVPYSINLAISPQ